MQLSLFKICPVCNEIILRKGHRKHWGIIEFEKRTFCSKKCAKTGIFISDSGYRKRVRNKRKNQCEKCGIKKELHLHHINGFISDAREENLITLCKKCHKIEHYKTGSGPFWNMK